MTDTKTSSSDEINTMVAFGQVVTVRPIPTRQVTQIVIEIPDNHHIAATTMLFGKNAFVLAANPKATVPFGVVPLEKMNDESEPKTEIHEIPKSVQRLGAGLSIEVNPTQWLGKHCQNAMFMHWIGARDAQEAAEKVRAMCSVQSRAEIKSNTQALNTFVHEIYIPYNAYSKKIEQDNHSVIEMHRAASKSSQRVTSI